jgi:hypothetical protein
MKFNVLQVARWAAVACGITVTSERDSRRLQSTLLAHLSPPAGIEPGREVGAPLNQMLSVKELFRLQCNSLQLRNDVLRFTA